MGRNQWSDMQTATQSSYNTEQLKYILLSSLFSSALTFSPIALVSVNQLHVKSLPKENEPWSSDAVRPGGALGFNRGMMGGRQRSTAGFRPARSRCEFQSCDSVSSVLSSALVPPLRSFHRGHTSVEQRRIFFSGRRQVNIERVQPAQGRCSVHGWRTKGAVQQFSSVFSTELQLGPG